MKKLITISTLAGRAGSSLTVGLLKLSGANVGMVGSASDTNNPKGYFEIHECDVFLSERFYPHITGFMPWPVTQTDPELNKFMTTQNIQEFEDMFFNRWFSKESEIIALKIPFIHARQLIDKIAERNGYEPVHIFLNRPLAGLIKSVAKMNSSYRTTRQWTEWLTAREAIKNTYEYSLQINFDDWFNKPYATYQALHACCGLPVKLTAKEVAEWVDPTYKHW